jgi:N-acetylglutamate synthase/N-acetylornithine aminotransferase
VTWVFGTHPNPGRILQAVGSSGVGLDPSLIDARIDGLQGAARRLRAAPARSDRSDGGVVIDGRSAT